MACNPHYDQPVTEKQVASSNVRKVLEICPQVPPAKK